MPSLRRRRPLSKMEVSIGKVIGKCGKIHHEFNKWRGAKSKKASINGIFSRGFLLSSIVTGQSNPQNPQISSAKAPVLLKGRAAPGFLFSSSKSGEFTQTMEDVEVPKVIGLTPNHPVVIGPWLIIETTMVTWGSPILRNPHVPINQKSCIIQLSMGPSSITR